MHRCTTCLVQSRPAEHVCSFGELAVPQQRVVAQTAEAISDVHKFLCKFNKLGRQTGHSPHAKGHLKRRQQLIWPTLTTRQKLAHVLASVLDSMQSFCQQTTLIAAALCCALPFAQLLWSVRPTLGIDQLIYHPGQHFFTLLADAVCFRYVVQLLLSPTRHKYQWILATVAVVRSDLGSSITILSLMILWAVNYLAVADCALKRMSSDERQLVHKLAAEHSRVPWLLPVHCMMPSARLIVILLIIGGIEINPGPVYSIVLTLLMLVTMPVAKRSLEDMEGEHSLLQYCMFPQMPLMLHDLLCCFCLGATPAAVRMASNPFQDKLTDADLAELLNPTSALRDPVVNFVLGLLQLETQQREPKSGSS